MRYKTRHVTRYRYEATVSQCHSEVRLAPRHLAWQRVLESSIQTEPEAASFQDHADYFGNDVTSFTILESHDVFTTTATSLVQVDERPAVTDGGMAWETVRQDLAGHARPDLLKAFEFSLSSPFVPCDPALADYARISFTTGRPIADASMDLMRRIHGDFRYEPKTTSVDTPLIEAFRSRRGVCQDFAHVMVGALRSLGLAARYVSGYLRSGALVGAEASHAWVAVFVPGAGWLELDPTNNVRPGIGHVTLAWGRDYGDVTPVKGIALGGGQQIVEVEVRVEPA
ncbi:MAG: transglutaminase family protein [Vicinamibacterales bacterium]